MFNQMTAVILLCSWMSLAPLLLTQNQSLGAQSASARAIDREALWQPGMGIMSDIRVKCGSELDFGMCFAREMKQAGATPQAVAFTKLIGNTGYLRDFREAGRVDVAYVNYPFRANENQGCLLVNGRPLSVDVDEINLLPKNDLMRDPRYAALAQKYPNISIFPGERNGIDYPIAQQLPDGGQRFILAYRLLNGCHACERIGDVDFAFDFDRTGKFLGRKFLAVKGLGGADAESDANRIPGRAEADSKKLLQVTVDEKFTLRLASNRATGYQWQLTEPPDETILKLMNTDYVTPNTKLVGAGGEEVWTFQAVGKGKALIAMKYVRAWEKNVAPAKSTVFEVQVE